MAQQGTNALYAPHPPQHGSVTRERWLSVRPRVSSAIPTPCERGHSRTTERHSGGYHETTEYNYAVCRGARMFGCLWVTGGLSYKL